jgi:hypothetical protein
MRADDVIRFIEGLKLIRWIRALSGLHQLLLLFGLLAVLLACYVVWKKRKLLLSKASAPGAINCVASFRPITEQSAA